MSFIEDTRVFNKEPRKFDVQLWPTKRRFTKSQIQGKGKARRVAIKVQVFEFY